MTRDNRRDDRGWVSYGDANYLEWGAALARGDWGTCYEVLHVETEGPSQREPRAYLCHVGISNVALGESLDHRAAALLDWIVRGDPAPVGLPPEAKALLAAVGPAELAVGMIGCFGTDEFQPNAYHTDGARLSRNELVERTETLSVPEGLLTNATRHAKAGR